MTRMKRLGRRMAIGMGLMLGALALALALLYGFAQSEAGRTWIARQIERLLTTPGEFEVAIDRLDGALPHSLRIGKLRIGDGEGAWMEATALRLDWRPLRLIGGRLWIEALEIDDLAIARIPDRAPGEQDEPTSLAVPSLPMGIVVERLAVDEVRLDAGVPAAFRIDGDMAAGEPGDLRAALLVERSDGTPGRIEAQARYRLADRHLELRLDAQEPAGGLIARALELPDLPAVSARFEGAGPLADWNGDFSLELSGLATAAAEVKLGDHDGLTFQVTGHVEVDRQPTQTPWQLLTGRTTFETAGRWDLAEVLTIEQARLANPAAEATLSGTLDLRSFEADARADVELSDDRLIAGLIAGAGSERLLLKARWLGRPEAAELSLEASTGKFQTPDIELRDLAIGAMVRRPLHKPELRLWAKAGLVNAPDLRAEGVTAKAMFRPDRPLDRGPGAGPLEIDGDAARLLLMSAPEVQALIGEQLTWQLAGRLDLRRKLLAAGRLELVSRHAAVAASGDLDFAEGAAEVKIDVALSDLAGLSAVLGLGVSGQADVETTALVQGFGESLEAEVSGRLQSLVLDNAFAQGLLTDRVTFEAKLSRGGDEGLAVKDLILESPNLRLAGSAALGRDLEELQADYSFTVENLAVLGPALGQEISGTALLEGRASGTATDPRLSGTLLLDKPVVDAVALASLRLGYAVEDLAGAPRGRLDGTAATPLGEIAWQTSYRVDADLLHLSELSLEAGETHASGRAAVPLGGGPIIAELKARSRELRPWLALTGVSGDAGGTAELVLSADGARQAGTLSIKLQDLSLGFGGGAELRAGSLALGLQSGDLLGEVAGTAKLTAKNVAQGDLSLDSLSVDAKGRLAGADVRFAATGRWLGPLVLDAAGRVALSGKQTTLEVARLTGRILGQDVTTRRRVRMLHGPEVFELAGADLAFGQGTLAASARVGGGKLAVDLAADGLPIAQLQPLWPTSGISGLIAANLKVSGETDNPFGQVSLLVTDLKLDAAAQATPGRLALSGDWRNERIDLEASLKGLAEQDAVFTAGLPLRLDPRTLVPGLPEREAIKGRLTWRGDLAELWPLVPITGHDLKGRCDIDLSVGGSLEQPRLSGGMALSDGEYESLVAGTLLRGLSLDLTLEGTRVTLNKLEAEDGAGGSLSARGEIEIAPARSFPVDVSGTFDRFVLLRRDDVTAAADGNLTLAGSFQSGTLAGQLESRGIEIRIPDRLPPQVIELEVVEAGTEDQQRLAEDASAMKQRLFQLALDLGITMPNRVFVRGRGLDSEWAGKLDVGGTAEQPLIKGKLSLVRGQISVIGQTFKLEEGGIDFLGGEKIDPLIDVKAVTQKNDLEVTVRVHGPAVNPEIDLSSNPTLPRDEIVSRLLFGRSTTQLSAIEAVQLAAAVAELSGAAGSRSFLDLARGRLGIDVLRVESVGEGEATTSALSAGKYIGEDVYLGVKQGTTAESGSVEVEMEITPNISLKSEVGRTGQGNLGVEFKWDY